MFKLFFLVSDDSGNTLYSIEYTFDGTTFYGFKGNLSEPRQLYCTKSLDLN